MNKVYEGLTTILLSASRVDILMGASLASLLGSEENKNTRVFLNLHIIRPMRAAQKAEALAAYLKAFRPSFYSKHKRIFEQELPWLRKIRNQCGHGLIDSEDDTHSEKGHIFSVHGEITLKNINPPPVYVTQSDVERAERVLTEFYDLIVREFMLEADEIDFDSLAKTGSRSS